MAHSKGIGKKCLPHNRIDIREFNRWCNYEVRLYREGTQNLGYYHALFGLTHMHAHNGTYDSGSYNEGYMRGKKKRIQTDRAIASGSFKWFKSRNEIEKAWDKKHFQYLLRRAYESYKPLPAPPSSAAKSALTEREERMYQRAVRQADAIQLPPEPELDAIFQDLQAATPELAIEAA